MKFHNKIICFAAMVYIWEVSTTTRTIVGCRSILSTLLASHHICTIGLLNYKGKILTFSVNLSWFIFMFSWFIMSFETMHLGWIKWKKFGSCFCIKMWPTLWYSLGLLNHIYLLWTFRNNVCTEVLEIAAVFRCLFFNQLKRLDGKPETHIFFI